MSTTRKKFASIEAIDLKLAFLKRQANLVRQIQSELIEEPGVTATVVGLLIPAIADSCDSLSLLASRRKIRDAYVTARTVLLTTINSCFICAEGTRAAERALRHSKQKAFRDLDRKLSVNQLKVALKFRTKAGLHTDPALDAAMAEFTGRRGQEIKTWTDESLTQQIAQIDSKYGGKIGGILLFGQLIIYRHASEIAHGTVFGSLWWIGATQGRGVPETLHEAQYHTEFSLDLLLFVVNVLVNALVRVLAIEFPRFEVPSKKLDKLLEEMLEKLEVTDEPHRSNSFTATIQGGGADTEHRKD